MLGGRGVGALHFQEGPTLATVAHVRIGRAPIFENSVPVRDILKIRDFAYRRIVLPCETVGVFKFFRSVHSKNNCAPVRNILKFHWFIFTKSSQIMLPCGAFGQF